MKKWNRKLLALSLTLILFISILPLTMVSAASTTFLNPVGPSGTSSADPQVMRHTDGFYYYVHTSDGWDSIDIAKSATLTGIGVGASKTIFTQSTTACSGNNCWTKEVWAPEINYINGVWYVYFTAAGTDNQHRVFVISNTSADPLYGTWSAPVKINTPDTWSIDQTVSTINGQLYMSWSESVGNVQRILISKMSSPTTLIGAATIISTPTLAWEIIGGPPTVNEGPSFITHGAKVHLSFSASGCWTDDYALGLLSADITADLTIASNWTKTATPVFSKTSEVFGPGHNSFVKSPDGTEDWLVYHANAGTGQGCGNLRTTRIQKITWSGDTPVFGTPISPKTAITRPSGEGTSDIYYTVKNKISSKVMTVGPSTADGANIYQNEYWRTPDQHWAVDPTDSGYYKLRASHSGKIAGVTGSGTADGANVAQYTYSGLTSQQWTFTSTFDKFFKVSNRNSSKMLDNAYGSYLDGGNIQQWTDNNLDPQRWTFEQVNLTSYVGYVMGYFTESPAGTGNNYGLHLAYSRDALNWTPLNNNNAVVTPTIGALGLRDPFIFRKQDGTFVVMATNLQGTNFAPPYNQSIIVWDSTDLKTFTNQRLVQLDNTGQHEWAPEAFYDASLGKYGIIWSGSVSTPTEHNVINVNYTTDFVTVEPPQVYFDPGFGVLDATMHTNYDTNYMYYKRESDNTLFGAKSTSLSPGSFTPAAATYTTAIAHDVDEAPIVVKKIGQNVWNLWGDSYFPTNGIFYAWESKNIDTNSWTELNKQVYNQPLNSKHATITQVTQTELDNLISYWGNPTFNRIKSWNFPDRYVRTLSNVGRIDHYAFDPYTDSQWKIVPGLGDSNGISFQSVANSTYYLRNTSAFAIVLNLNDNSTAFKNDATFYKVNGFKDPSWTSFRSKTYSTRYIRHSGYVLRVDPIATDLEKQDATFKIGY